MTFNLDDCVRLWIDIFGDSEDFIHRFYAASGVRTYTQYDGNVLCGMVNRVPIRYGQYTGGYIYAACTHPDYRGNGIFSRLLNEAEADMAFMMLIPAEPALYPMYRKLGYDRTAYSKYPCEIKIECTHDFVIPFDGDYKRLYSIYLQNSGDNEFIKPYDIFVLSVNEFVKNNMIYYNNEMNSFIIYETNSKNIIKIFDIYCKNCLLCDTIDEHESGVYKILDESLIIPEQMKMKVNLFMEV